MKSNSVFYRFFKSFLLITFVFLTVIGVFFSQYINGYFKNESYKMIQSAQRNNSIIGKNLFYRYDKYTENHEAEEHKVTGKKIGNALSKMPLDRRAIMHTFLILDSNDQLTFINPTPLNDLALEQEFMEKVKEDKEYLELGKKQSFELNSKELVYIIEEVEVDKRTIDKFEYRIKDTIEIKSIYVLTSMWGTYSSDMSRDFLERYIVLAFLFLFLVSFLTGYFSRRMSIKFKKLENTLAKLGRREWDEPVLSDDSYEIGRLSQSIDLMRKQLKEYDEDQKNQFHTISHELKTPIMIIKGYLDSIMSGLYPKGNLPNSLGVVYQETDKMENMVKNILYLNKMDYLTKHYKQGDKLEISEIIEEAINRFEIVRSDLEWNIQIRETEYRGTKDQWELILDNILSNQVRYAKSAIEIKLTNNILIIENDGDIIEKEALDKIFEPFYKGINGQTGLGLSIVKRLLDINGYSITAKNHINSVSFEIKDNIVNK